MEVEKTGNAQRLTDLRKAVDKDVLPDIAHGDTADHIGHVDGGPEGVPALQGACEQQAQHQAHHIAQRDGA